MKKIAAVGFIFVLAIIALLAPLIIFSEAVCDKLTRAYIEADTAIGEKMAETAGNFVFCEMPTQQEKYDAIKEEEVNDMGIAMREARSGIFNFFKNLPQEDGQTGELVQPVSFNAKKNDEGEVMEMGVIFTKTLIAADDYSLENIDLSDEAMEERFGVSANPVLRNYNGGGPRAKNALAFIEQVGEVARQVAGENDLYASVMIAQMALESGWGSSTLALSPHFNFYGIKANKEQIQNGKYTVRDTYEYREDGSKYLLKDAKFASFGSMEESIAFYAGFFKGKDIYKNVPKSKGSSYKDTTKALTGVYATDPEYYLLLNSIIEKYELTKFDQPLAEEKVAVQNSVQENFKTASVQNEEKTTNQDLKGKVITIDAGHGATDSGASSKKTGYKEKTFNLIIAKGLQKELETRGATVHMTRTTDTYPSIPARPKLARDTKSDILISIHANANNDTSANGTETLYRKASDKILAEVLQKHMIKAWGLRDRGLIYRDNLGVLNGLLDTTIPGVILETSFISNEKEEGYMKDPEMQKKMILGLTNGVLEYYGLNLTEELIAEMDLSSGEGSSETASGGLNRPYNNFITAWYMGKKMQKEFEKFKKGESTNLEYVFDDIIAARAEELKFELKDWVKTVQSESYMCFFLGDGDGMMETFEGWIENVTEKIGIQLKRNPCENLDIVFRETFGYEMTFIPKGYQGVVAQTKSTGAFSSAYVYPEITDILGTFELFTTYEKGVTLSEEDDDFQVFIQKFLRDNYDIDYEIKSIVMIGGDGAVMNNGWLVPMLKDSYTFTSGFGPRWGSFHYGADMSTRSREQVAVYATKGGKVISSNSSSTSPVGASPRGEVSGCGGYVIIDHGDGTTATYCHMKTSEILVKEGWTVLQGQLITAAHTQDGGKGISTGIHLDIKICLSNCTGRMEESSDVTKDPINYVLNKSEPKRAQQDIAIAQFREAAAAIRAAGSDAEKEKIAQTFIMPGFTPMSGNSETFGQVSEYFETTYQGPGFCTADVVCGTHQMIGGTQTNFVTWLSAKTSEPHKTIYNSLKGKAVKSQEMANAFKKIAQADSKGFEKVQKEFFMEKYFQPAVSDWASQYKVDLKSEPIAVQEAVFSTQIHYGKGIRAMKAVYPDANSYKRAQSNYEEMMVQYYKRKSKTQNYHMVELPVDGNSIQQNGVWGVFQRYYTKEICVIKDLLKNPSANYKANGGIPSQCTKGLNKSDIDKYKNT